jgi:simple sugar transport system ATP-binding protein
MTTPPILEARSITKRFGRIVALDGVDLRVDAGAVTCLLGDNGAGKSTLISTLSGVVRPDAGTLLVDGEEVQFAAARDALDLGIATAFQDLAMIPLMPIGRSFFLGREPTRGVGPFRRYDGRTANRIAQDELHRIGIDIRDANQPVGTLSGGERQSVAIARAVYFGARALILDEPTSALGVHEAEMVLRYIDNARTRGLGIVFITHNVHHAYAVGDTFTVLNRGRNSAQMTREDVSREKLAFEMAGGREVVLT